MRAIYVPLPERTREALVALLTSLRQALDAG